MQKALELTTFFLQVEETMLKQKRFKAARFARRKHEQYFENFMALRGSQP